MRKMFAIIFLGALVSLVTTGKMIAIALLIVVVAAVPTVDSATCSYQGYEKVGCFKRNEELFSELLITDLDPTHHKWGKDLDWAKLQDSLHSLACRCEEKARNHFSYFAIGFYGECWAGNNTEALKEKILNPGAHASSKCVSGDYGTCDRKSKHECAGIEDNEYVYEVVKSSINQFQWQASITRSNQITTLRVLKKQYDISFGVYPTSFRKRWHSILHFTTSRNGNKYGSRIPGIWFSPSPSGNTNSICVANAVSGNKNYHIYSPRVPLNQWAEMRLTQTVEGSKYVYRIYLNGTQILQKDNTRPEDFHNVKVYVGDPWYAPQQGYIRNLRITNTDG